MEFKIGDLVSGKGMVGKVKGIETLKVGGSESKFVLIENKRKDASCYLPLKKLAGIRKLPGKEDLKKYLGNREEVVKEVSGLLESKERTAEIQEMIDGPDYDKYLLGIFCLMEIKKHKKLTTKEKNLLYDNHPLMIQGLVLALGQSEKEISKQFAL